MQQNLAIEMENISKVFGSLKANNNVNLSVRKGEVHALLGENGAGKSTLMNMVAGKLLPDAGEVEIDGQNVSQVPEHVRSRMIGRVFQDPMAGTAPNMTI